MTNEELLGKFRARLDAAGFTDADQQAGLYVLCNMMMTVTAETVLETLDLSRRHEFMQRHKNRPDTVAKLIAIFTEFAWDAALAAKERGDEGVTIALPVPVRFLASGTMLDGLRQLVERKGYAQFLQGGVDVRFRPR